MHVLQQGNARYRAGALYRRATARDRALADIVVCGAQKSGTTYLADLLGAQPGFYTPPTKEIHFFNGFWDRGPAWYRAHFERCDSGDLQVDASPSYMIFPEVAVRIRATNPAARLVFLLRDPAARAHSHYHHNVRAGLERLDFAAALAAEDDRLAPDLAVMERTPGFPARQYALYSYRTRGLYERYLRNFYALFPREQILVLDSTAVFRGDAAEFSLLSSFLEHPVAVDVSREVRRNAGSYATGEDTERAVLAELRASYAPLDDRLAELAGRSFSWMAAASHGQQ